MQKHDAFFISMKNLLKINIAIIVIYLLLLGYSVYQMLNGYIDYKSSPWFPTYIFEFIIAKYYILICLVQLIIVVSFLISSNLKALPVYGNLIFSISLGGWALLMQSSPTHISFDEVYLGWLAISIANLGFAIWALLVAKPKQKKQATDILDDSFSSL